MKAGIIVDSLIPNQLLLTVSKNINKIQNLPDFWDVILFFGEYNSIVHFPQFALMHLQEIWGFDGPTIATSISTAKHLINAPRPCPKFFYVWNLEWLYKQYDVDYLYEVYCNPKIELIARNEHHAKILTTCWKKPISIIEEFNYEQLINLFR